MQTPSPNARPEAIKESLSQTRERLKRERQARIKDMPGLRRAIWRLLALGWIPGVALGIWAGWAASAFFVLLSLAVIVAPILDPHPSKALRVIFGFLISPIAAAAIGIAHMQTTPPETSPFSEQAAAVRQAESAQLTKHLDAFAEDAQDMLDRFTAGELMVIMDKDLGGTFAEYRARGALLPWSIRNDVLAAKAVDLALAYLSRDVAPHFDARHSQGAHVLVSDRLVAFIDPQGIKEDNAAISGKVKDLYGKQVSEMAPEKVWPIAEEHSGDHILFCYFRGEEVTYVKAIGRSTGFNLETLPGAAPMLRVCEIAATMGDLSHLPKHGAKHAKDREAAQARKD